MFKQIHLIVLLTSSLASCTIVQAPLENTGHGRTAVANPDTSLKGKTMSEIIASHAAVTSAKPTVLAVSAKPVAVPEDYRRTDPQLRAAISNHAGYTRTEENELKGLFPRLPNPDLCMYVYPHLSGEGATVAGYTSCIPMYEKNEYALTGELPAMFIR